MLRRKKEDDRRKIGRTKGGVRSSFTERERSTCKGQSAGYVQYAGTHTHMRVGMVMYGQHVAAPALRHPRPLDVVLFAIIFVDGYTEEEEEEDDDDDEEEEEGERKKERKKNKKKEERKNERKKERRKEEEEKKKMMMMMMMKME